MNTVAHGSTSLLLHRLPFTRLVCQRTIATVIIVVTGHVDDDGVGDTDGDDYSIAKVE